MITTCEYKQTGGEVPMLTELNRNSLIQNLVNIGVWFSGFRSVRNTRHIDKLQSLVAEQSKDQTFEYV